MALAFRLERTHVQYLCLDEFKFVFFLIIKDPYKSFGMPSIGRLEKYIEPAHIDQVSVPVFYFEYHDFVKLSS